jgi:nicotinate-nucleotide adenylyltransferase
LSEAATTAKRIGMFGGSFDPPHLAHVALARAAVAQLQLDVLLIIPAGQAWYKERALSAAGDRLAMSRLAFDGLERVQVDTRELERPGPSFTIDTLEALQAENPGAQLHLIIGKDQFLALTTWHRWEDLVQLAIICIADRADPAGAEAGFSSQVRLPQPLKHLQLPLMPFSATDIRRKIASGAATPQSLARLVPEAVARYIEHHRLYLSA